MSLKQTPIWKFPFLKPAATDQIKVSVPNQNICTQLDMMITRRYQSFRQPPTTEIKRLLLDISERTIDIDGDIDVLSANQGDNTISWYENDIIP